MNPFTEHTRQQGISYSEHGRFALGIAWRLLNCGLVFAMHAIFPFIDIEHRLDLEATAAFLLQRNRWIERAKTQKSTFEQAPENQDSRSGQTAGALS